MEALWIAVALVVAVLGGWPVTAGILKLARSKTVRAADSAEAAGGEQGEHQSQPATQDEIRPGTQPATRHPSPVTERVPLESVPAEAQAGETVAEDIAGDPEQAHTETEPAPQPTAPTHAPTQIAAAPAPTTEVLRGGLLIGCLERAAVAVAILSGQPVAIAYVVAIKGLGRYPELKDTPAASERFIIGTLASMLWAASVAVLTKALLL